ncbi:hypothetical protein BE04_36225 [Sorangium cellulosum]|uniref:Uncharacterized protein n=1 Tax=Sorangium cellulosum TaxID=56 RepID=A0A150PBT4_SORCE|nr:hypothetical protein BE04_36225 [Sorangium cellulosum]
MSDVKMTGLVLAVEFRGEDGEKQGPLGAVYKDGEEGWSWDDYCGPGDPVTGFASYQEALADMLATLQIPTGDNADA